MIRESFKFYHSFYETLKPLSTEAKNRLYNAICVYGLYRIDSELNDFEQSVFAPIRDVLELDWQEYELQNKPLNKKNKCLIKENKPLNKSLKSLNNAYLRKNKAYLSLNKSVKSLNKRQNE